MKRVSFYTIFAAKTSNIDAIKIIVQHFKHYIMLRCLTHCTGADGHDHIIVDTDLWDQAISSLLSAILRSASKTHPTIFRHEKSLPRHETGRGLFCRKAFLFEKFWGNRAKSGTEPFSEEVRLQNGTTEQGSQIRSISAEPDGGRAMTPFMGERTPPAPQSSLDKAAGQDTDVGLILASAMRHSVGRPAMGMGGGTIDLWSGFARRRPARL